MKIYGGNIEKADVFLRPDSYLFDEIKGDNIAVLSFDVLNPIDIRLNDYILIDDAKYKIRHPEQILKEETSLGYRYTVTFYADQYELQNTAFFLFGQPERKKLHDTYNGTARQVLDLIVQNLNRNDSGWSVGSCIQSEQRTFNFKDMKCSEVLDRVASEFETEYWVKNKTVFVGERKYPSSGLILGQGEGAGFKQLEVTAVSEVPPTTVLFPYGSDKNLGSDYGNDFLVLPNGQVQLSKNVDKYGRFEVSKQFDSIFPKGEFKVTKKIDNFTLQSSDIDFNLTDCLLDGVEVIVTFQDGQLAGYDLAIVDKSWKNDVKQFKLKVNEQENALKVPGDINFQVGDKFILTGLKMPQAYINKAEKQLQAEAQAWLDKYAETQVQLQGKCDDILFKRTGITIETGQMVTVYSEKLDINREIRVTAVKKYLENGGQKPYRYEITLADFVSGNGFKELVNDVRNAIPTEIANNYRSSVEFTKRRFRDAQETMKLLQSALLDYSEAINPITVQTMSLLVGDESLQYRFVDNKTNPQQVAYQIKYNNDTKVLSCPAGIVQHMTLGIKDISSKHKVSDYKFWNIPLFNSPAMPDGEPRFLYIKTSKTDETGVFVLSKTAIGIESVTGFYHLLCGILTSEIDGTRSFVELYGFTEILPGRITTDRIVSADGQNFMDFVNNAFRIGNSTNSLEFNTKGDGKLVLKGTLVQSPAGDTQPIGVFRGAYNASFTYYKGDEVTYNGSTYRFIYDSPQVGKVPTDTIYWIIIASKGEQGISAGVLSIAADSQVFKYNNPGFTGTPSPSTINLRADVTTGAGTVTWYYLNGTAEVSISTGATLAVAYNASYLSGVSIRTIRAKCTYNGQTLSDDITIAKLGDGEAGGNGTDAYTVLLTNESHTVACDSTGTPLTGEVNSSKSSTGFIVYRGITQLSISSTASAGYFTIAVKSATGCTASIINQSVTVTEMSADSAQVEITINCEGKTPILTKVMTLTKSRNGSNGTNGTNGKNGDYFEYRYAKNGSTTVAPSLVNNTANPAGWTTTIPSVGQLEYLWMTIAKKDSAGNLLQNWSAPVRTNGSDGAKGDTGPVVVFRGEYNKDTNGNTAVQTYYGTSIRVDCVKYNGNYYVAQVNAGNGFQNVLPTDTTKWNTFGAQFESVATNLLLAEMANIGDWVIKGGKITSQYAYDGTLINSSTDINTKTPRAQLDGINGGLILASSVSDAVTGNGIQKIILNSQNAILKAEMNASGGSESGYGTAYMNSQGIFANRAGIQAIPSTTGITLKGAVVGLGFGNVPKDVSMNQNAICGVFGNAVNSNANPAPSFGGYFFNLMAAGLNLAVKSISNTNDGYVPTENDCFLSCYNTAYITLYFNPPKSVGKVYYIRLNNATTVNINVNASGGKQLMMQNGSLVNSYGITTRGMLVSILWDGSYWLFNQIN